MSLKKQALSGMVWTFAEQFGNQIINFGVSIILARLLLPSDFGTIAMFGVVMGVSSVIISGGMASSIIRSKEIDDRDLSTVFWFNMVVSLILYGIIYLTAPLIAQFFEVDILTPIIRVYCVVLIINAFVTVQKAYMTKNMDFKTLFKIQLPSLIIGGTSGIIMAYMDFGVWTLVYYPIIQSTASTLQYWFYSDWRPSFIFDKEKFKFHFNFGYKMTLSGLISILYTNVYTVIIGKFYSSSELGYYNRANTLQQLPVMNLSSALNRVTFPLFSKISHDNVRLKDVYKRIMKVVVFVIAPVLCLMMVTAEPLIRFMLTDKWMAVVPYFQVLALSGLLYPLHSYNLNVLMVKGRSDLFLRLEIIKKIIGLLVLLVSVRYGVIGIIWGRVVNSVFSFFVNSFYSGRLIDYNSLQQLRDLLPSLVLAGAIALGLYFLDQLYFTEFNDFIRLVALSLIYGAVYLALVFLLRLKEIDYLKGLLKK